jgi:hypothetical protein
VTRAIHPWVSRVVRLGYVAKGIIYSLIGFLAMRVGFGLRGGRITDPGGVLMQLLQQPFGMIVLTLLSIGIIGYTAYYLVEAIADLRGKGGGLRGWIDRSLTIIKAVFYGLIGVQALRIVLSGRRPNGDPEDQARMVMSIPLGSILLILIGIGIAVYGVTQINMALKGGVDEDIDVARVRREAKWLLPFGRAGAAARGVILILMGWALSSSGLRREPSDADGYREVLITIASINPWLLAAMGAGLLSFGLYQLCHARYAKLAVKSE